MNVDPLSKSLLKKKKNLFIKTDLIFLEKNHPFLTLHKNRFDIFLQNLIPFIQKNIFNFS